MNKMISDDRLNTKWLCLYTTGENADGISAKWRFQFLVSKTKIIFHLQWLLQNQPVRYQLPLYVEHETNVNPLFNIRMKRMKNWFLCLEILDEFCLCYPLKFCSTRYFEFWCCCFSSIWIKEVLHFVGVHSLFFDCSEIQIS